MSIIPADEKTDLKRGLDHIGISICAVVHDGNGNVLLMQRGPKARDENGHWDICGGAIEFGESIDEALRRELMEELQVEPLDIEFLTVYDAHRHHNERPTHWIALVHAVRVNPEEVEIGEPHKISELKWFDSQTLPSPLHSQFFKSFAVAKSRGFIK